MSILLLSLKQRLQEAFPELQDSDFAHHASDLYAPASVGEWLRQNYEWHRSITGFTCQVTGRQMLDIPFAFDEERDGNF